MTKTMYNVHYGIFGRQTDLAIRNNQPAPRGQCYIASQLSFFGPRKIGKKVR